MKQVSKLIVLGLLAISAWGGTVTVTPQSIASVTTITVNALDLKTHFSHLRAVIVKIRHPKKKTNSPAKSGKKEGDK